MTIQKEAIYLLLGIKITKLFLFMVSWIFEHAFFFSGIGYCAVAKEEDITVLVTVHQHQRLDHLVVMSNHTACSCACVPKKCSPWQRFDADLCTCVCINDHDKNSCNEKDNKQWDRRLCRCVCSITYNCGLRYNFNTESCQCEPDKNFIHEISGRL